MISKYKPLTPPDKKAYEPYVKPKFVDDSTPTKKKKFKKKPRKAQPLFRVCEKCGNIANNDGSCDFCGHQSSTKILTTLLV